MASSTSRPAGGDPRIPWADYAKGICICFVVMMHSTLGVGDAMGGTGFMHHVVEFARPFRMPDFFLISGLFLSFVINRDWRLYLDRKVVHFAYFYVLWFLIQGVFKWPGLALDQGPLAVVEAFLVGLVQPFGTLWFIYLLPIFFVAAKLMKNVPPVLVLAVAAALETARIATGSVIVDEFAMRFFYFCVGWYAAPYIFALAKIAADRAGATLAALIAWAVLNEVAVSFDVAILPGVSLVLGLMGCAAVIATAALLARFKLADALRYAGEHSIVIYLAFFLPMAATRTLLIKTGIVTDIGWVSLIVTVVAIVSPVILYVLVQRTGYGRFLFERPAAFRIDGKKPALQPAE
jgi:uncharacterized membrane protein YcfT